MTIKSPITQKILRNKILVVNCIFLLFAVAFAAATFSRLKPNQFLLIHDQSAPISAQQLFNTSFVRLGDSGGLAYGIQSAVSLPNNVLYDLLFRTGLSIKSVQFVAFSLCLYLFLSLAFFGFRKLNAYFCRSSGDGDDFLNVFLVTVFYCFGFLNIMFMNSGIFWSITYVLSYALFPMLLYYVCKFVERRTLSGKEAITLSLLLAAAASRVIFFVPIIFSIIIFVIFRFSWKNYLRLDLKKLALALIAFVLLFAYVLIPLFFEIFLNIQKGAPGALLDSTASLLRGGFFYQFINLSSWVVYTPWSPRSVLSFYEYYLTGFYAAAFLSVYIVILGFLIKSKDLLKKSLPFLSVLLLAVFFAKGPQPPLGGLYSYLVSHVPMMSVIRSPDNKFGIGICFALAALLLIVLEANKKKKALNYLRIYVAALVIVASYPLIAGKVVLGENIPDQSGKFATEVFPEYQEAIDVLNRDRERSSVLIYPASNLPNLIHGGQIFIGKDVLRAQSNKSFLYLSYDALINSNLLDKLKDIYYGFNFESIKEINARYVIVRKDTFNDNREKDVEGFRAALEQSGISEKLADNKYLQLYKIKDEYYQPKIFLADGSGDEKVSFSFITPVKYLVEIDNIRGVKELAFLESYNKYWKLYPLEFKDKIGYKSPFLDLAYLFKTPVFDSTHETAFDYANSWKLDAGSFGEGYYETNPDGSKNVRFIVYFLPQSYFYSGALVSGIALLVFAGYLMCGYFIKKFNGK